MNKKTVKSFVKSFVAIVKGDDATATAEKVFRQAQSALNTQIATLTGDTISKEDAVADAEETLEKARVNNGSTITDRNQYVRNLLLAKNALIEAEENLLEHLEKLDFLKSELQALEEEETIDEEA